MQIHESLEVCSNSLYNCLLGHGDWYCDLSEVWEFVREKFLFFQFGFGSGSATGRRRASCLCSVAIWSHPTIGSSFLSGTGHFPSPLPPAYVWLVTDKATEDVEYPPRRGFLSLCRHWESMLMLAPLSFSENMTMPRKEHFNESRKERARARTLSSSEKKLIIKSVDPC